MDKETNDLIEEFVLDGNDFQDWSISYSIAPTDVIPIIREWRATETGAVSRVVDPAVWDFKPGWMTTDAKRPQFNARVETVATNGLFKSAFAGSRCIVPMRGYFEWTGEAGDKQPHFLHGPVDTLAAAGIYTSKKVGEEWVRSVAIITREARDGSGEVHDRMPVFLTPDVYDAWLNPAKLDDGAARDETLAMLESVSLQVAATITSYEVDRKVNNSRTVDPTDPSVIAPAS